MTKQHRSAAVALQFQIEGQLSAIATYGSGHINDTYCAVFHEAGVPARFIVQRINTAIFRKPAELMENIQRVTAHMATKMAGEPDSARRVLKLIPARDGRAWYEDTEGGCWRAYRFIEGARAYAAVESAQQAFQAGRAFGEFQKLLVDLPAPRLHDTIPNFHNTPKRFAAFEEAVAADAANRAFNARAEIEFAFARKPVASLLLDVGLPERITHNDTKFNNVLLDDATGEGLCVIDLDTVMPALALYDFGDMVRTATSTAVEDERDLSRVTMHFPLFEALLRGYLSSAGSFLTKAEKAHLAVAGKLITFEQGIRFLTDYLSGDAYYKVHRDGQNLDRCRTQFKLVESIEEQEEQMSVLISELAGG
jgi:aminoglycoside phosphotransferase (APT) family kinase protein